MNLLTAEIINRISIEVSRVAKISDQRKYKLLCNSCVMSNFGYSPLTWMFCGKTANKEINRVLKRVFRILLRDYDAPFDELLVNNEKSYSCSELADAHV